MKIERMFNQELVICDGVHVPRMNINSVIVGRRVRYRAQRSDVVDKHVHTSYLLTCHYCIANYHRLSFVLSPRRVPLQ
jgi:hypothetical protein